MTQMHETPQAGFSRRSQGSQGCFTVQALTKFVLTSFPNIGLPLSSDRDESIRRIPPRLCSFAAGAALPFLVSGGPECADIMVAQISSATQGSANGADTLTPFQPPPCCRCSLLSRARVRRSLKLQTIYTCCHGYSGYSVMPIFGHRHKPQSLWSIAAAESLANSFGFGMFWAP